MRAALLHRQEAQSCSQQTAKEEIFWTLRRAFFAEKSIAEVGGALEYIDWAGGE